MEATAVDINIQAQEMEKLREELNGILAKSSGQPLEKIQRTRTETFANTNETLNMVL